MVVAEALRPNVAEVGFGLVYWGLTPQQQPGSYQGGEMMMKSVFWWRKPEHPEETTDLRQVTDETFHTYGLCPVRGSRGVGPPETCGVCIRQKITRMVGYARRSPGWLGSVHTPEDHQDGWVRQKITRMVG